jgi:hypothetical protein
MGMGHGDNNNSIVIDAVNKGIREPKEKTSSDLWFDFQRSMGISRYKPNGPIKRVQKLQTLSLLSLIKPNHSSSTSC